MHCFAFSSFACLDGQTLCIKSELADLNKAVEEFSSAFSQASESEVPFVCWRCSVGGEEFYLISHRYPVDSMRQISGSFRLDLILTVGVASREYQAATIPVMIHLLAYDHWQQYIRPFIMTDSSSPTKPLVFRKDDEPISGVATRGRCEGCSWSSDALTAYEDVSEAYYSDGKLFVAAKEPLVSFAKYMTTRIADEALPPWLTGCSASLHSALEGLEAFDGSVGIQIEISEGMPKTGGDGLVALAASGHSVSALGRSEKEGCDAIATRAETIDQRVGRNPVGHLLAGLRVANERALCEELDLYDILKATFRELHQNIPECHYLLMRIFGTTLQPSEHLIRFIQRDTNWALVVLKICLVCCSDEPVGSEDYRQKLQKLVENLGLGLEKVRLLWVESEDPQDLKDLASHVWRFWNSTG